MADLKPQFLKIKEAEIVKPLIERLYGHRYRVIRRLSAAQGLKVDSELFDAYNRADIGDVTHLPDLENLSLINAGLVDADRTAADTRLFQLIFETLTDTLVDAEKPEVDYDLNGLRRTTHKLIGKASIDLGDYDFVVGESLYAPDGESLLMQWTDADSDDAATRVTAVYIQPGIIDAEVKFNEDDGLLYVTFVSVGVRVVPTCLKAGADIEDDPTVAFQGGAKAELWKNRIKNVKGLRTFVVTVAMRANGSALATGGADNVVASWQDWAQFTKPGEVILGSGGIVAYPGNERWVKVLIEDVLSTSGNVPDANKPFSVKSWAGVNVSYTPSDKSAPVIISKGAVGYLADSTYTGSNSDFAGVEVDSVAGVATSDPTPAAFYALNNQVIDSKNGPSVITDAGVRWYRRRKITVVGTFGTYLDA